MPSAPYLPSSYLQPVSLRRRATAFALAAVANLLLLLMLFNLAPTVTAIKNIARMSTFSLTPAPNPAPSKAKVKTRTKKASSGAPARTPVPVAKPAVTVTESPIPAPLNMIIMSKDVLAATDLAMNTKQPGRGAGAASGAGKGDDSGADDGEGTGPGGEKLYNAEWYVEPTNAELAGYLPSNGPRTGWGMIACRTMPQNRVDDCVELGQSPPGSGFARAVRQAAWQFRVRPPRVGERRLVGAWVRIRIDYGSEKAK